MSPLPPALRGGTARARFAADAASVPAVRGFVTDHLGRSGPLLDDAALCVSELAANAAVHGGGTFMEVEVAPLTDGVRISVADEGRHQVAAVRPGADYSGTDLDAPVAWEVARCESSLDRAATRGRGLAIVAYLAYRWGVDPTPCGKLVWAELRAEA